jgi:hypothetical protein
MKDVLVAARAVLLPLDALGMQALVLRGEVVAVFAVAARENDFISGHWNARESLFQNLCYDTRTDRSTAFADGEA